MASNPVVLASAMSTSLHLDDIRDGGSSSEPSSRLDCPNVEPVDPSIRDQIKLFMRYMSACSESRQSRPETLESISDMNDEFIQKGRDSCAVSGSNASSRSSATLDSFLIKPENLLPRTAEKPEAAGSNRSAREEKESEQQAASTAGITGLRSQSMSTRLSAGGEHTVQSNCVGADHSMYKIQVSTALSSGKAVWL